MDGNWGGCGSDQPNPSFLLNGGSGTVYEVEEGTKIIARRFAGFPAFEQE